LKGSRSAILGILISLLTTLIIFKITETSLTWTLLANVNFTYLTLAVLFQVAFWLLWAFRLREISKHLKFEISILTSFQITTERVLDSIFFILALPVFLIFTGFATDLGYRVAIAFLVLIGLFLYFMYTILKNEQSIQKYSKYLGRIFRGQKIAKRLEIEMVNFREGAIKLLSEPLYLFMIFTITAIMWSACFLIPSLLLLSFNQNPHFLVSYTAQLIIVIISLIPLTPGSSGIAETSMAYLYSKFVELSVLGSLVAVWRFITYHLNIIFGAISLNASALKNFFK